MTDEKKAEVKRDSRIEEAIKSGDTGLIVSQGEAQPGERIIVTFYLANNPGIIAMSGIVFYDENYITLENVQLGDDFKGILDFDHSENLKSGCELLWSGEKIEEDQICDGIILELEFSVQKDLQGEKIPITFVPDKEGVCDNNLSTINLLVDNGWINVLKKNKTNE